MLASSRIANLLSMGCGMHFKYFGQRLPNRMPMGYPMMIGAETVEQRAFLAKQANMERMSNNPVSFTDRDITEIFSLD